VKCRGQKELNDKKTLKEGLQGERAFFDGKEPWRSTRAQRPELFGIHALRAKLSNLQLNMIQESIPGILKEISMKTSEAERELEVLGDLVSTDYEKRQYFRRLAERAMTAVRESQSGLAVNENASSRSFMTVQQEAFDRFGSDVLRQKLANISKVSVGTAVIVDLGELASQGTVVGMSADGKNICVTDENVQKDAGKYIHHFLSDTSSKAACSGCSICKEKNGTCGGKLEDGTYWKFKVLDKDDVRCDPKWLKVLIADNRNNDLRCFLSATLFNAIVRNMIRADWKPLCESLIDESHALLLGHLTRIFEKEFKARYYMLWASVEDAITSVLKQHSIELKASLSNVLDMDTHPYTQNHYLFDNISKKRNDHLKRKLIIMLQNISGDDAGKKAVNLINAVFDANSRRSMDDHVAAEMEVVLDSYGKVCAKRIIDQVPMNVMSFNRRALQGLEEVLSGFTDSQLAALIVDGPEFAAQHARAKDKLKKMKKAFECFKAARSA